MNLRTSSGISAAVACLLFAVTTSHAVSPNRVTPQSVAMGKNLFEKTWTAQSLGLAGDGLGPLFNAKSCVACHHQGGVGGGGDSRFNAITIGIERVDIVGMQISEDVVAGFLRGFHPGFGMTNTLSLPHHGGSAAQRTARIHLLNQVASDFSKEGGSTDAAEVRLANATPILHTARTNRFQAVIRARLYQRNTTALFGAGLIDQVSGKDIEAQVDHQKQHPEISGRAATLRNGRYGKFGWRGNNATLLEFVDQACAAELGLQTKRKVQPADSMNPAYRNPSVDINDDRVDAMRDFIAALPAPTRRWPETSHGREIVLRGEQVFAAVGCAVCHPAQVGPVQGIYSDLLLHDMGRESIDLSHAEPHIIKAANLGRPKGASKGEHGASAESETPEGSESPDAAPESGSASPAGFGGSGGSSSGGYGGGSSRISGGGGLSRSGKVQSVRARRDRRELSARDKQRLSLRDRNHFFFEAPEEPLQEFSSTGTTQLKFALTNFNQEWRTPPLWGVADSAPYMHDGRADTLLESIAQHEGEGAGTRDRFLNLPLSDRHAVIAFLKTLVAPPDAPPAD